MAEYISREDAISFFHQWIDDLNRQIEDSVQYPHLRSGYKVCKTQLEDCIGAIQAFPAADVQPVVHKDAPTTEDLFDAIRILTAYCKGRYYCDDSVDESVCPLRAWCNGLIPDDAPCEWKDPEVAI